jgi:hypothetical protein
MRLIARAAWVLWATVFFSGCVVRPWQRERLSGPEMQFQMAPFPEGQRSSIVEITEGGTFGSAGPGSAGAGCGCH